MGCRPSRTMTVVSFTLRLLAEPWDMAPGRGEQVTWMPLRFRNRGIGCGGPVVAVAVAVTGLFCLQGPIWCADAASFSIFRKLEREKAVAVKEEIWGKVRVNRVGL